MSDEHDEFVAGFYLDRALWLDHDVVPPEKAAELLCPDGEVEARESLRALFSAARNQERSLLDWARYARERRRTIHHWLDIWLRCKRGEASASVESPQEGDSLAGLFDPVPVEVLEKMFPADGMWARWAERAKRNGLAQARVARGLFNPYRAAEFFLRQGIPGWDWARCMRVLANNLPERSGDARPLLTGGYD